MPRSAESPICWQKPSARRQMSLLKAEALFASHSWRALSASVVVVAGIQGFSTQSQAVHELAFEWGAAHPDLSGCWSGNETFEACCISWSLNETPGQACWGAHRSARYAHCCIPKPDFAPRSFFSCTGKGIYWERFRQTLALFRDFSELSTTPLDKANPKECLIGGVLGQVLALVHVSHYKHYRSQAEKERDYDRAEHFLRVLLQSPVSLEEVLVSGWPLFLSLDLFRSDPSFQNMAQRRLTNPFSLSKESQQWSYSFSHAIGAGSGKRISVDALLKLLELVSADRVLTDVLQVLMALVNYYNLRTVDQLRAEDHEIHAMGLEAKRLIMFSDMHLKRWLSRFEWPFSLLIQLQLPLVSLLQALSWPAVVLTRPGDYLRDTIHFAGHQVARVLQGDVVQGMPLLEQHLFPGFDAASNMVRATETPMCYADSFLLLVAAMASARLGQGMLRIWDVGASYGDCLLWAASMLYMSCPPARHLCLELRGFEPLPVAAAAFKRSARSFTTTSRRIDQELRKIRILVEEFAMRDTRSFLPISFPSHSMALATFLSCEEQYSVPPSDCVTREARSETLDAYLARLMLDNAGPVDLLKVHVQGDELTFLRGGNASLLAGLVCVLSVNLEHISLQAQPDDLWVLLSNLFRSAGFVGVLVNLWDVKPVSRRGFAAAVTKKDVPWRRPGEGKMPPEQHELVLWRSAAPCGRSAAVAAARRLWESTATAF